MKKLFVTLALLGGIIFNNFAQTTTSSCSSSKGGVKFSIGAEGGLPVGDASNSYSAAIGGSLKGEFPTTAGTYLSISAGYSSFLIKSALKDLGAPSLSGFIPLKAGIKRRFSLFI